MRIAINTLSVNLREFGGGEKYLYYLLNSLAKIDKQNQYFILVSSVNKDRFAINQENFTQVLCPIDAQNRLQRILWEQAFLQQKLKKLKIDVLHSPNNISPLSVPCKSVVTIQFMINFVRPKEFTPSYKRWYFNSLMKLTAKRSDKIISVSGNLKKEIVKFLKVPEEHVVVVQHGVSDIFFPVRCDDLLDNCKKKYGIKDDYILFVGNNVPGKNLENLVRAFNDLKGKYKISHQLVLVGSIDLLKGRKELLLAAIQQAQKIDMDRDVVFTGFVEHNELPSIYSGASVFVFPSYCESFGMPLLEAMACGVPIITSNISAMPEVAGDAGILVNPYDVEEIVEAVYQVLSKSSLREKLVEKGLEKVKHFSWENIAKKTLAVYQGVYGNLR